MLPFFRMLMILLLKTHEAFQEIWLHSSNGAGFNSPNIQTSGGFPMLGRFKSRSLLLALCLILMAPLGTLLYNLEMICT